MPVWTERSRHVVVDDEPGTRATHLEAGERERASKGAHVVGAELVEDASGNRRGEVSELGQVEGGRGGRLAPAKQPVQDLGLGLGQVAAHPNATAGERGDHARRRGRTWAAGHAEEVAVVRPEGRIWTIKIRITEVLSTRANIYRGRARRPLGQVSREVRDGRVEEVAIPP